MPEIWKFLEGKKTYLAAAALVLLALVKLRDSDYDAAWQCLAEALGLFGLRAAVEKAGPPK